MKNGNARPNPLKHGHKIFLLIAFSILVAMVAVPFYSLASSSSVSKKTISPNTLGQDSAKGGVGSLFLTSKGTGQISGATRFGSLLAEPAPSPETITIYASDCTTPKADFALGETVCAVTENVPENNRFVNWVSSDGHEYGGPGQTDITNNQSQSFLYTPTKTGSWKATIADPSDSSIIPAYFTVDPAGAPSGPETIATYQSNCTTASSAFTTGSTVCARAGNLQPYPRRIYWVNPDAQVVQVDTVDQTHTGSTRQVTQVGNWKVYLVDATDGSSRAVAGFSVADPQNPAADLSVVKTSGDGSYTAGGFARYTIIVTNYGPDVANSVTLSETTPNNTSFIGVTPQDAGAALFTCTPGNPTNCTASSMAVGAVATFSFVYQVAANAPVGTVIENIASVSSQTTEINPENNTTKVAGTVTSTGGGTNTCSVACPDDIQTTANTHQDPNDPNSTPGAVVHFSPPSGNDECGVITVNHCNDCFFPQGSTVVTATATTGESCSFTVKVTPPSGNAPTISCPANQSADAPQSSCSVNFSVGTATATGGTNVTIYGQRSDGESMYTCDDFGNCTRNSTDAPFTYGVTTITWTASSHDIPGPYNDQTGDEDSHRTGSTSCTQTITVNDVTPPTISAANGSASADANCQALVPDYSNTVSDNCSASISYTQTPAAGTLVGAGAHTVHIEANDNSSNNNGTGNTSTKDVTFTVNDTTAPTVTAPADSSASADANCQAPVPNYVANSTASDNCDSSVTLTQSPAAGTMVGAGPHTVTVTGTDDAGNQGTDTVVFTVNDTTAPTVTAPADSSASADANCQAPVPDYTANTTASDNCDSSVTLTQSPAAGTLVGIGPHTVTVTATDDAGNHSSDDVVFTVNDTTAPTVTAPADSSASADASCQAPVPNYVANSTASDNCDSSVTLTQSPAAGTMVGAGPHTVTVTGTDDAGNQGTDTVVFTVNDTTAPTVTAPADSSASADANCQAAVPDYTAGSTASDNCDSSVTLTQSPAAGTMVGKGPHTVTVTGTDDGGNQGTDTVVFTVNDTTAPVITCPANITRSNDPGTCSATINPGTATATDNCDNPTITGTRSDGQALNAPYPRGTTTITWTATDSSGNHSSCTQTVTVNDTEAPTITTNGQTPILWPASHEYHTFNVTDFVTAVSDNCDTLTVSNVVIQKVTSDEPESGGGSGSTLNDIVIASDCKSVQVRAERRNSSDGRVYTITFKVTDSSGNVGTKTSQIHVPKNLGVPVVDSGPHYTVNGTCP